MGERRRLIGIGGVCRSGVVLPTGLLSSSRARAMFLDTIAAGKQAVVADAVEACRQDVAEEAADELVGGERHHLVSIGSFAAVVLPLEGDGFVVERDQAAVGDGDAVGVAGQIGEHRFGSAERALCVDDPLGVAQWRHKRGEGLGVAEMGVVAEEVEAGGGVGCGEHLQEQSAEQSREHAHRQEEAGPTRQLARAVQRDAAARHDDVDVRVMPPTPKIP